MDDSPKLCKDCKYVKRDLNFSYQFACCTHPDLTIRIDMVTGKPLPHFADFERASYGECGPDAKLFEQRNSIRQEISW